MNTAFHLANRYNARWCGSHIPLRDLADSLKKRSTH